MFIDTCLFINSLLQIQSNDKYNHIIQHTDKETKQTKKNKPKKTNKPKKNKQTKKTKQIKKNKQTPKKQTKKTKQTKTKTIISKLVSRTLFFLVCFFFLVFPYSRTRVIQLISLAFPVKICLLSLGKHGGLVLSGHAAFLFEKYVSLQIIISLEVLLHYFWETHVFFSRCFFFNWKLDSSLKFLLGKNFFITKHNAPWSVAAFLLDLLKNTCLFQDACFNWETQDCLKLNAIPVAKCTYNYIYNFVWKNCFITIQIVPWSVAAILLKNGCLLQEDWFSWECSISQNIYFDLGVPVQYQSAAYFCFGFLYIKMQDYFKYLLHAPLGGM